MAAGEKTLRGSLVVLRPPTEGDVSALAQIRTTPEVYRFWRGGDDLEAAVRKDMAEQDSTAYVMELVEDPGTIVGWIQWQAENDPDYRCADMDLYVDPALRGRGVGPDALRALIRHLADDHGFHRVEIDPAADNGAAIRAYEKVGFRPVGVRRLAERGEDGAWHDSLLMDLVVATDLAS